MNKPTAQKLIEEYGKNSPNAYTTANKPVKHATRTEHTGKFRPRDGGSNGGYDKK